MQDESKKRLLNLAKQKSIIAFDCFDTLVHRTCSNERVLIDWARHMERILQYKVTMEQLYKTRKEQEQNLKKEIEEPTYDELLKAIYNTFSMDISLKEFCELSKKVERNIEQKVLVSDKDGTYLLKQLKKDGKKVVLISDFYFGKELLTPILNNLNLGQFIDEIFVSSDIGKRKSTGNLYKYVLEKECISSQQMLMIGDNKKSDVEIPSSLGIATYHKRNMWDSKKLLERKEIIKKLYEMSECESNPINGYIPILLLFCERLYKHLVRSHQDKVYFCSREGQGLKKIFDYYQSFYPKELQITTAYLYVSRKATVIAGLNDIEEETFDTIFSKSSSYSLKSFMEFMEFSQDTIDYVKATYEIDNETVLVNDKKRSPIFEKIITDDRVILEYNKLRKEKRKLLEEYLIQQGINITQGQFCLVDIGWKGSIQDNLRKVINENVTIQGYYLGIFDKGELVDKCYYSSNNLKTGVVFSTITGKNKDYFIFRKNRMFLETLFTANHGPVMGYKEDGRKICPIIKNDEIELEVYQKMKVYLENLYENYKQLIQDIWNSNTSIREIEKEIKKCYLKRSIVDRPKYISFYNEISEYVVENYISSSNEKKMNEGTIKFIMKKIHSKKRYFFDYNMHFLDVVYEKKIKLLYPVSYLIGNIICEYMNLKYN